MEKEKDNLKLKLISKKWILYYFFLAIFLTVAVIYLKQETITKERAMTITGFLLVFLGISLFVLTEIPYLQAFFKKNARYINALILVLTPPASFVMTEIMVSNFNISMIKKYGVYNIVWYIFIYFLFITILRSSRVTVILGTVLIYLAGTVNYLVYLFRGNPIIPSDLLAWKTGMSVASNYNISVTRGFLIATIIMFTLCALGSKLENRDKKSPVISYAVLPFVFTIFFTIVIHTFFNTELVQKKIRVIDFFAPKYTYSTYGTAFGFVANIKAMETQEPEGYSVKMVEELLENAKKATAQKSSNYDVKPNIIVIMNEAYSDLGYLGDYRTNIDYRPYTRALKDNTIQGKLYVSVFGGATSDTEYEFLTGNSMAVLPANCVPYQQYITESTDSLAAVLKAQGYYNIAIHPYKATGYKRDMVYPLLGFDRFVSEDDFDYPELIRSYISDRESFKKVIEEYEEREKDGPVFIFNVTMQDHGGYSAEQLFSDEESVKLIDYPEYRSVEQYLSLLRTSDLAFEGLVDYFKRQEEPTLILMFGDHQPAIYSEFYNHDSNNPENDYKKYQVPFLLWANYDIEVEHVDEISANYLASYLLDVAGLQKTYYHDYLSELRKKIPVINALFYISDQNEIYKFSDQTGYSNLITQYRYVGYNNALDKKKKQKTLYSIPDSSSSQGGFE